MAKKKKDIVATIGLDGNIIENKKQSNLKNVVASVGIDGSITPTINTIKKNDSDDKIKEKFGKVKKNIQTSSANTDNTLTLDSDKKETLALSEISRKITEENNDLKKAKDFKKQKNKELDEATKKYQNKLSDELAKEDINFKADFKDKTKEQISYNKKDEQTKIGENETVKPHNLTKINEAIKKERSKRDKAYNDSLYGDYIYNNAKVDSENTNSLDKTLMVPVRAGIDIISTITSPDKYKDENGKEFFLPSYNELKQNKVSGDYDTKIGKFLGDAGYNISKIGAAALVDAATAGLGGKALYWTDMTADNYKNDINQGHSKNRAIANSLLSSGSEFATEKLLGGLTKGLTGGKASGLHTAIADKVTKATGKAGLGNVVGSAVSEGTEEFVQEYLDKINRALTLGEKGNIFSKDTLMDALYSGGVGAFSGGAITSVANGDAKQVSHNIQELNAVKEVLEQEKNKTTNINKISQIDNSISEIDNYLKRAFTNNTPEKLNQINDNINSTDTMLVKKQQDQFNEVQSKVQNGIISPQDGTELIKQIQDGTYEQNQNINNYATETMNQIQNALSTGQITQQDATQMVNVLSQTVEQQRNEFANNESIFSKQVDDYVAGTYNKNNHMTVLEHTPDILQKLGVKDLPITLAPNKLDRIMNDSGKQQGEYHGLHDMVKKLPEAIQNPLDIVKSHNNSYVLTTDLSDNKDRSIILSLKIDGKGNIDNARIDTNVMTSAYGRNNYDNWMKRHLEQGNILYDIDRGIIKQQKKSTSSGLQLSSGSASYIDNISQDSQKVNNTSSTKYSMQESNNNSQNQFENKEQDSDMVLKIDEDGNTSELTDIPKILDKVPKKGNKMTFREKWQLAKRAFVDKGEEIYRISKATKNDILYHKYDRLGTAQGEGQSQVGTAQTNLNGKKYKNFTDEKGNNVSMSLDDIWRDANNHGISDSTLNEYLVNYLNLDRLEQGVQQFGNLTAYQSQETIETIEKQHPHIERVANNIWQFNRNQLEKMVDAGIVSKEAQENYSNATPHYVRIQRDINKSSSGIFDNHGNLKINNQIKQVKGGVNDILPLKESMAQYTIDVTKAIRKNIFGQELAKTLGSGEESNLIALDNDLSLNPELLSDNKDGTYSFTVFQDGIAKTLPIDKGIYEALSPNKHYETENLFKIPAKMSSIQRTLITDKNPLFLATNFFKDIGDAPLNSKYGLKSFYSNYANSVKDMAINGQYSQLYVSLGGEQNSYFNDGQFSENKVSKVGKVVEKVMSPIEKGNEFVERAPRLGEFITTIKENGYEVTKDGDVVARKGKNPTKSVDQVLNEAMYNSAEITTNFKRGGDIAKAINRSGGTFFNASIQGFDKQIRNFTELKGNKKQVVRLMFKLTVLGIAPTLANAVMYDDDKEYDDLPDYVKDSYYLFKTGNNDKWIRIPRGRAISVFQSSLRRGKDAIKGKDNPFSGFTSHAINQLAPNNPVENNVISPFVAVTTNKSWNGSEIVTDSLKNKYHKEEEFDAKTDEFSKWLGKKLNASPKKINYLIDQYSGVVGDILLPSLTKQAENEKDDIVSNIITNPIQSKFTTDSVLNNKSVSKFYDAFERAESDKKYSRATGDDSVRYKYLTSKRNSIADLYKIIKEIQSSNKSSNKKYKEVKEKTAEINKIAKEAVQKSKKINGNKYYKEIDGNYYYKYREDDGSISWQKDSAKKIPSTKSALVDYYRSKVAKRERKAREKK